MIIGHKLIKKKTKKQITIIIIIIIIKIIMIIIIITIIIIKQPCMNIELCYTDKESERGTANLLVETIYSIVVFKIDAYFVSLKKELPSNSTSENLESFRSKLLLPMFQLLFMRINRISEKETSEVVVSTSVPQLQIGFSKS